MSGCLGFSVRSVVNPLKFTFANFATTSVQLFPLFWKAVGILEENFGGFGGFVKNPPKSAKLMS